MIASMIAIMITHIDRRCTKKRRMRILGKRTLETERAAAIIAAKELLYDDDVIERLKKAETLFEIERILVQARLAKY